MMKTSSRGGQFHSLHLDKYLLVLLFCIALTVGQTQSSLAELPTRSLVLPEQIVASLGNYAGLQDALAEQQQIDWYAEHEKARAITVAYAITEYINHITSLQLPIRFSLLDDETSIDSEQHTIIVGVRGDPNVERILEVAAWDYDTAPLGEEGFLITSLNESVLIFANTRVGALYGVYQLLEQIGFMWPDPQETIIPSLPGEIVLQLPVVKIPNVVLRGVWTFGNLGDEREDDEILPENYTIWLARNKFNLAGATPATLSHMLGVKRWSGGHHVLRDILASETLFAQHPDWYGQVGGQRQAITKDDSDASYRNPNFANAEMATYVADQLIVRLKDSDLKDTDILNLWPADSRYDNTWDQSSEAKALGNFTDNLLNFYAVVTQKLEQAYSSGELNRLVHVAGISYFQTWEPPTNLAVLEQLMRQRNYIHVFYTNKRSYSLAVDEQLETRTENSRIVKDLQAWQQLGALNSGIVEYYNFSIFGAVAFTDLNYLAQNLRFFSENNKALFAYMHPVLGNAGPRRLTNFLIANLTWQSLNTGTRQLESPDSQVLEQSYFLGLFGNKADSWQRIYHTMSTSTSNVLEMMRYCSLSLFDDYFWSSDPLKDIEVTQTLNSCKQGGVQTFFDLPFKETITNTFIGLDESIALQHEAQRQWQELLKDEPNGFIRNRMLQDVEWFEATLYRYNILSLGIELFFLKQAGNDDTPKAMDIKRLLEKQVSLLLESSVTSSTASPVNQRNAFKPYETLYQE